MAQNLSETHNPNFETGFQDLARGVYTDYAAIAGIENPAVIYQGEYCAEMSVLLQHRAAQQGWPTQVLRYFSPNMTHFYLGSEEESIGYVYDLTWQQFLSPTKKERAGIDGLSPLLINQKSEIRRKLGRLGLSRRRFPIWEEGEPDNFRWQSLRDPALVQLMVR